MNNEKFIAKAAKALGDRNRLLILREIARQGSINCTQAQQLTNLAQPSVSHHIRQLTDAELVDTEKRGREVNLILNHDKMDEFLSAFGTLKVKTDLAQPS
jgi:ArsR family transcriptional regulator, arsenate/arsenite/antimonite-responsive transcriptional repressor